MMRMMIVMICILITAGRQSAHGSQNELDDVCDDSNDSNESNDG